MSTKRLYLLRHAHSPGVPGVKDIDRELSAEGVKQASALGQYMKNHDFAPDMVLCSSAHRTRTTLSGVMEHMDIANVEYLPILYAGTVGDYLAEIQQCNNLFNSVLVVAHNPNIYGLAAHLAEEKDGAFSLRLATRGYAPATLTVLDVPEEKWAHIQPNQCPLVHMADPSEYL